MLKFEGAWPVECDVCQKEDGDISRVVYKRLYQYCPDGVFIRSNIVGTATCYKCFQKELFYSVEEL